MRLSDTDRWCLRQHAPLCLVARFLNGIDPICQVNQRNIVQPFGIPVDRPIQRIVNLKIATPVAVSFRKRWSGMIGKQVT